MGNTQPLTIAEAAEKLGVSVQRIRVWCRQGRIAGAVRFGSAWQIPRTVRRPKPRKSTPGPRKAQVEKA